LQRAPIDSFDSSLVLAEFFHWLLSCALLGHIPYHQLVVVASGGEYLRVVWAPAQAAHLLPVTSQLACEIRLGAHISHEDLLVLRPRGNHRIRPGASTDSVLVPSHLANHFLLLHIPDLNLSIVGTNGEMRALLGPGDARDAVLRAQVNQLTDARGVSIPDVNMLSEGHG